MQLSAQNISKSFGATRALVDVSTTLESGMVRALVGENGAGKSTLFKVLAAHEKRDAGTVTLDGQPYDPANTHEAEALGVAIVLQEITINPSLGIAENIFIDRMRRFNGAVRHLERQGDAPRCAGHPGPDRRRRLRQPGSLATGPWAMEGPRDRPRAVVRPQGSPA